MKISFVVPTYNRGAYIEGCVESVLRLPYPDVEIVVVDDGSTDDTADHLRRFNQDSRVRVVKLSKNEGQNHARNAGIRASTGDIVAIMDSDDEALPAPLKKVVDVFERFSEVGVVFTASVARSTGRVLGAMGGAGRVFGLTEFLGGTYRGEYQPFMRKRGLPIPVFSENLGLRRSCTTLTWVRLARSTSFYILDIQTRLYGDTADDRMGRVDNVLRDANEIIRCNDLVLRALREQEGASARSFRADLDLDNAFYALLASGRHEALRRLRRVQWTAAPVGRLVAALGALLIGPSFTRWFRRRLAHLRAGGHDHG